MRTIPIVSAALVWASLTGAALAQAPSPGEAERSGRFLMQPVDGGVLRMDMDTGAMALCTKRGEKFACEPVQEFPVSRGDAGRLETENRELRAEIKRLEELLGLGDKPATEKPARRSHKFELPTEEDLDKAMGYVERMIKKFREKMKDLESGSGRGTPL
jgi:hypothetical protein